MYALLAADPTDIGGLLTDLLAAAQAGKWMVVVGVVLMLLVLALRIAAVRWISKWFATTWGGVTLAFGTALLTTIGGSLAAGQGFSWGLLLAALSAAWTSAGLHDHLKKLTTRAPKETT